MKHWTLTQPAFHRLLDWFDEGTNSSGQKYEEMRRRLISYFDRRDCPSPGDLADETLNRVTRRLEEVGSITGIEPAKYCYIKAKEVLHEYWRKPERKPIDLDDPKAHATAVRNISADGNPNVQWEEKEKRLECLDQCLQKLGHDDRDLIIRYYYGEKRVKIDRACRIIR